jgi:WD40 repeat protein
MLVSLVVSLALTINLANAQNLMPSLTGHTGGVWAIIADKDYVYTGSTDNSIIKWDLQTGAQLLRFVGHTDLVRGLAMHSLGLVSVSNDQTIRLWNPNTGAEIRLKKKF